jgi:hypothetical protein
VRDDVPHTWNNERWVIDRLVEAVEAGDTDAKPKLGQRLLDGIRDDAWRSWRFVEDGYFLPFTALDPANLGEDLRILWDEGTISAARKSLIDNGGELVLERAELERWREIVVERAFAPECATSWVLFEFHHSGSKAVFVGATGQQPSRAGIPKLWFAAAYSIYSETLNGLKSQGFIGRKDYQARSAHVFAQILSAPG